MNRGDAAILLEVLKKVHGPNNNLPQSTINKTLFKLLALFLYREMYNHNTNKLGNEVGKKKPISKRELCIHIATFNKPFRALYIKLKGGGTYPKTPLKRKEIGLRFYKNVVCDNRKNKEIDFIYTAFKRMKLSMLYQDKKGGKFIKRKIK